MFHELLCPPHYIMLVVLPKLQDSLLLSFICLLMLKSLNDWFH